MNNRIALFLVINLIASYCINGQNAVSINEDGSTADPSALLDVKSTNKGFLPPRMTYDQRGTIPTPAAGLIVYCTDCGGGELQVYNGQIWTNMVGNPASSPGSGSSQVYFYGTTEEGGANGLGTIYRIRDNGTNFEKVFDFSTVTGHSPVGGVTQAPNGKLYGFTAQGGQLESPGAQVEFGTFYEFDPITSTFSVIQYIDELSDIGYFFQHSPTLGSDGKLYFSSEACCGLGGQNSILSSYDPASQTLSVLDTLTAIYGTPKSKWLSASDGDLYVVTNNGGSSGAGTITKYDVSADSLVVLYSSLGDSDDDFKGAFNNELFEASNGVIYGCSNGGGTGHGAAFKINKDGTGYLNIFAFTLNLPDEGWRPQGGFFESNGILYGSTTQENNLDAFAGTLFTINISTNSLEFIYTLDDVTEGARPKGVFAEGANGRWYLTCQGDNLNNGSIISFNPASGQVSRKHVFNITDGAQPGNNNLSKVIIN